MSLFEQLQSLKNSPPKKKVESPGDYQKRILEAMEPGVDYRAEQLAELTKIPLNSVQWSLLMLSNKMEIERKVKDGDFAYTKALPDCRSGIPD